MRDPQNTTLLWMGVLADLYSVHARSITSSHCLLAELAWEGVPLERREPYQRLYYALIRDQEIPPGLVPRLRREVALECHPGLEVLQLVAEGSTTTAALLLADTTSVGAVVERMAGRLSNCSPSCPGSAFLSEHLADVLFPEVADGTGVLPRRALFAASWALCWAQTHEPPVASLPEYHAFLRRSVSCPVPFEVLRDAAKWSFSRTMSSAELEVFYGLLLDGLEGAEAYRLALLVLA